ncbi:CoA-transferase [Oceanibacterium hippocampi]|uniref:Glutaconate CoA-transferase subunit B n=1 Tax=Oceanibacterium hippocampi TaxID=745714 RepID=A0A1Y5RYL2_9PROT|nr:CoA-transferase [Oceanibacterium hippocampi]SLN28660.1 Glutaconate CoA-transferase subunit B [Oceanibacterium hippocampi]
MSEIRTEELLIAVIARLLGPCRHVAVGASSPIPAAGAMLRRAQGDGRMTVNLLGSEAQNRFTSGGVELFDCAAQGRIDAFFLGGGQIDGQGNINLVGIGDYPDNKVRWPGSFGSAYLYHLVPNVILFREEHSRRVFVPKVDFVSAPGISGPEVNRPGGPKALLTGMALFDFDRARPGFRLRSVHPGYTLRDIEENTGFAFEHEADPETTEPPDPATLALIRGPIAAQLAETYPRFAERVFGSPAASAAE